jgi:hypothetical protein
MNAFITRRSEIHNCIIKSNANLVLLIKIAVSTPFALTIELNSGQRHYEFTKSEISGKENGKHFGTSNKNVRINSEYL